MADRQISVQLIKYNSCEYQQACQLRYELFFAEHKLPWNVTQDERQADYFHGAVICAGELIAYGQLIPHENQIYQVCQMVVKPNYQRQNLGGTILKALTELAKQEGAIALTLNSRLTAVGFYQKFGFQTYGLQFPSATTKVPHITMNKKL